MEASLLSPSAGAAQGPGAAQPADHLLDLRDDAWSSWDAPFVQPAAHAPRWDDDPEALLRDLFPFAHIVPTASAHHAALLLTPNPEADTLRLDATRPGLPDPLPSALHHVVLDPAEMTVSAFREAVTAVRARGLRLILDVGRLPGYALDALAAGDAPQDDDLFAVAAAACAAADGAVAALDAGFPVDRGGFAAVNDPAWFGRMQERALVLGTGLSRGQRRRVAAALRDRRRVAALWQERAARIAALKQDLTARGYPVGPARHHLLLQAGRPRGPAPAASAEALAGHLLAHAGLHTAPRAPHGVALFLPLGLPPETFGRVRHRLHHALTLLKPVEAARRETARPQAVAQETSHEVSAPLSHAQERLYFMRRLQPDLTAYKILGAMALTGPLDPLRLHSALADLAATQDILRTAFEMRDGEPRQVVVTPLTVPLHLVDLSGLPRPAADARLHDLAAQEAAHRFDHARAPLWRATLVRLAPTHHVVLLNQDHLITDGWSWTLFLHRWIARYRARASAACPPMPRPALSYAAYAAAIRRDLDATRLAALTALWREALDGAPTTLELPTDKPRPTRQSFRGDTVPFRLSQARTAALKSLATRHEVSLFAVLAAGMCLFLHRYAAQDDLLLGFPVAGRDQTALEDVLGLFVNTLTLRARPREAHDLTAYLQEVAAGLHTAHAGADLPFDVLVERLQPARDLSRNPITQAAVAFQDLALPDGRGTGLTLAEVPLAKHAAHLDLLLVLSDGPDGLWGELEFAGDLWHRTTATRMVHHLQTLFASLADAVHGPADLPLHMVSMIDKGERRFLLHRVQGDRPRAHAGEHVHRRVAHQAAVRGDHPALVFGASTRTYAHLWAAASRLAARLRAEGAAPERLVGISLSRKPNLIIALLAVLESGAAYLPLSPDLPAERLQLMLGDTACGLLLLDAGASPPDGCRARCLFLDDDAEVLETTGPPIAPARFTGAALDAHPAYVIYTSGSTGTPKGVVVPHGGLARSIASDIEVMRVRPEDRVLHFVSFNFDAAVSHLFMALCAGATVYLADEGADVFAMIRRLKLTRANFPTGVLAAQPVDDLPTLTHLLVGGEACTPALAARWAADRLFFNVYGPTETTITATMYRLRGDETQVPIGKPIAGMQAHVVDRTGRLCALGVPGELWLGGAGVTRGYLGRPGLTADRFVPDPFGSVPGARLYRSGDHVRRLDSGDLVFLQRRDRQVKLRGFRLEIGEIEAALHQCTAAGVVDVVGEGPGARLAAWYVPRADDTHPAAHLRTLLPAYMVPSHFVKLEALPLTHNGKVDRDRLPEPAMAATGYTAPRTKTEAAVCALWAQVLGLPKVGVHDNYFDLGGQSLMSIRLTALVRARFGRDLPISLLFGEGTPASMAAVLDAEEPHSGPLVTLNEATHGVPLFLLPPVNGDPICYREAARACAYPVYGLRVDAPPESIDSLMDSFEAALTAACPSGDFALGGWSVGCALAVALAHRLRDAGRPPTTLVLIDGFAPAGDGVPPSHTRILQRFAADQCARVPATQAGEGASQYAARVLEAVAAATERPAADVTAAYAVFRAMVHLWSTSTPEPLPLPATLYLAEEPMPDVAYPEDGMLGWRRLLPHAVRARIAGNHDSLVRHLPQVLPRLDLRKQPADNPVGV